jgi:hypothetical protein
VNSCKLLPCGDAAAAAAALLAAVGCLKHLTQLRIMCNRDDFKYNQNLNAGDPAAYTALTASSALRELTYASKGHHFSRIGLMHMQYSDAGVASCLPYLTYCH